MTCATAINYLPAIQGCLWAVVGLAICYIATTLGDADIGGPEDLKRGL